MICKTLAGLTAIIASVSAIQADATAQWYGGYNYNPWAQQSHGSWYGVRSSPFGYGGESKVQRMQRDVSYLVKMNSALNTRVIATEEENSNLKIRMNAYELRTDDNEGKIK